MDLVTCEYLEPSIATRSRPLLHLLGALAALWAGGLATPANAQAPAAAFPSFPQNFTVQGQARASFPLAITQPGPIVVDVDVNGGPVVVVLQGHALAPMQQQGSGHVHLSYAVTPADVQHTSLWVVSVALATPGVPGPLGQAQGTVRVQKPPGDPSVALAEANAAATAAHKRSRPDPQLAAQLDAARAQLQAKADQDAEQRRAAIRAAQQPVIDQLWGRAPSTVGTRALPGLSVVTKPASPVALQPLSTTPPKLTVPPPPPPPVITNVIARPGLTPTQAGPLDQVTIIGQNFGSTPADVLFLVGPNTYIEGIPVAGGWNPNGTSIVVQMPDASGLQQFDGSVFVQLNPAQSNQFPIRFVPAVEYRHVYGTQDAVYASHTETTAFLRNNQYDVEIYHPNTGFMAMGSDQGTDVFFSNTSLKPGWSSSSFNLYRNGTGMPGGTGEVAVSRYSPNDPSLRFTVLWSYSVLQDIDYGFDVVIAGPRGTSDGVVVP